MSQYSEGGPGSGPEFQQPGYGPGPEPLPQLGGFASPAGDAPPTPQYGTQPPAPGYGPGPGYPQPMYPGGYYGPPMVTQKTNGMAVTGMVVGILSLVLFWASLLGLLLAVLGIIFSSVGMSQCTKTGQQGKGMAIAGLVCSLIATAFWVAIVIIVASILA
jgi:hypothetical protein